MTRHRGENKTYTVILGENRRGCVAERVEFSGAEVLVVWTEGRIKTTWRFGGEKRCGCVAHRVENKTYTVILGEKRRGCVAERVENKNHTVILGQRVAISGAEVWLRGAKRGLTIERWFCG